MYSLYLIEMQKAGDFYFAKYYGQRYLKTDIYKNPILFVVYNDEVIHLDSGQFDIDYTAFKLGDKQYIWQSTEENSMATVDLFSVTSGKIGREYSLSFTTH